ncbi:MAG: OsmC family protein [Bacillaceae bacterium]|nr:OsmC family protein [Bacillaceae bacterium]
MNHINFDAVNQTVEQLKEHPEFKMRKWNATVKWKNGVQNRVSIREFDSYLVDEPETLGGTDQAPNPVEYLIGAAASCFAITFQVMASQEGITLKDVEVQIEADLNAAVFLGLEDGNGGILNPKIILKAETDGSMEQIKAIAETALSKSPVIASLTEKVQLQIEE